MLDLQNYNKLEFSLLVQQQKMVKTLMSLFLIHLARVQHLPSLRQQLN